MGGNVNFPHHHYVELYCGIWILLWCKLLWFLPGLKLNTVHASCVNDSRAQSSRARTKHFFTETKNTSSHFFKPILKLAKQTLDGARSVVHSLSHLWKWQKKDISTRNQHLNQMFVLTNWIELNWHLSWALEWVMILCIVRNIQSTAISTKQN